MKRITVLLTFVLVLLGCATTSELEEISEASPTPELSPREVVELQLRAFRANDEADQGIGIAFRFASPRNRRATGPVGRFAQMMKGPLYRPMLVYDELILGETVVRGRVALQRVVLEVEDRRVSYDFYLVLQEGGTYDQCWMTEAVSVVPNQQSPPTLNV